MTYTITSDQMDPQLQQALYDYLVVDAVDDAKVRAELHNYACECCGAGGPQTGCTSWITEVQNLADSGQFMAFAETAYGQRVHLAATRSGYCLCLMGETWWPGGYALGALQRIFMDGGVSPRNERRCRRTGSYSWQVEVFDREEGFGRGVWVVDHWLKACERVPAPSPAVLHPLPGPVELNRLKLRGEVIGADVASEELSRLRRVFFGDVSVATSARGDHCVLNLAARKSHRRGEEVLRVLQTLYPKAAIHLTPGQQRQDPFTGLHGWAIDGVPAGDAFTPEQSAEGLQPVRRLLVMHKLVERLEAAAA